jgi:CubicO group peptidase (beta-lactamase class C family)
MEVTGASLVSGAFQVNRAGRVLAEGASGTRDPATNQPCTPATRFQPASISKQFVAAAVMLLQERGRLNLDDPVARWWRPAPAEWSAMHIGHLLGHTSGLPHWDGLGRRESGHLPAREEILDRTRRLSLGSEPGRRWRYSGPGYLIAAEIVGVASGRDYPTFVTEQLFRPLGMTATTSGLFPEAGYALGIEDGRWLDPDPNLAALPGTGDVWTTTGDLLRYADAVTNGELLGPGSWDLMGRPHATVEDGSGHPVTAQAYGYGTYLGTVDGRPARFHTGDNPGYRAILVWLPKTRGAFAVLANDDSVRLDQVAVELARLADS